MRRKRARQRIVLHTDFLSDWLILCLLIERERLVEFLTAYPFPVLIMSIRDCTRFSRFTTRELRPSPVVIPRNSKNVFIV